MRLEQVGGILMQQSWMKLIQSPPALLHRTRVPACHGAGQSETPGWALSSGFLAASKGTGGDDAATGSGVTRPALCSRALLHGGAQTQVHSA